MIPLLIGPAAKIAALQFKDNKLEGGQSTGIDYFFLERFGHVRHQALVVAQDL
jgi:hypothetical protein